MTFREGVQFELRQGRSSSLQVEPLESANVAWQIFAAELDALRFAKRESPDYREVHIDLFGSALDITAHIAEIRPLGARQ